MPYSKTTYSTTVTAANLNNGEAGIETAQATAEAAQTAAAAKAGKPATAAGVAYVDPAAGNDSNDGLSWGSAKATIAAAVTSITRGTVYLARGTYSIGTAVSIPNFVSLEGQGQDTLLRCTGNNYAIDLNPANRVTIRNLMIDAATSQASGGGINFANAAFNVWLSDIYFGSNLHTSLNIAPTTQGGIYTIERIRWNGVEGCTYGIVIGDGNVICSDIYISHACGTAATITDMDLWVDIAKGGADTVQISESLFFGGAKGMLIGSRGASGDSTNHKFTSLIFDNCDEEGVDIQSCRGVHFANCAVQGAGQAANNLPGVRIGTAAKMVQWNGGFIHECERDGIWIMTGSLGTRIRNADILNNNRQTVTFGAGITVSAAASDWSVTGCTIGNNIPGVTANQNYGIVAAGGAGNNIHVTDNDFPGNLTAPWTNSGVTGVSVRWERNLPDLINSKAAAATLALPPGEIVTVTGNTNITSITASYIGRRVTLSFTGTPTVTDGSNLKLGGNLIAAADATLSLICDGTNWIETGRSGNVLAPSTKTTSYTLALADADSIVEMNSASAQVFTIPPNSSVAFPIGTTVELVRIGAGSVTITPGAGVTIPNSIEAAGTSSRTITSQYTSASLYKRATDAWVLSGSIT